jgi:hypothetical protein
MPSPTPTGAASPGTDPSGTTASPTGSADATAAVPLTPAAGRLVWGVDAAGQAGLWTTNLVGGDVFTYVPGHPDDGSVDLDLRQAGDSILFIRQAQAGDELWVARPGVPPSLLLDDVYGFLVVDATTVLVDRLEGATHVIRSLPLDGGVPVEVGRTREPLTDSYGAFGMAISPDGRTVAAGWVGGHIDVFGPTESSLDDVGAPLVVADDGTVLATVGRAGEAYRLVGDEPEELAPADSDPLAVPRSGVVAWGAVDVDGALRSIEVRDLIARQERSYPAIGPATNVRSIDGEHVLLEATAFDPLTRTVTVLELGTGRVGNFEASAPPIP